MKVTNFSSDKVSDQLTVNPFLSNFRRTLFQNFARFHILFTIMIGDKSVFPRRIGRCAKSRTSFHVMGNCTFLIFHESVGDDGLQLYHRIVNASFFVIRQSYDSRTPNDSAHNVKTAKNDFCSSPVVKEF